MTDRRVARKERGAPIRIGQRRVAACDLGDVRGWAQPNRGRASRERSSRLAPDSRGRGDEQLGAREGCRPQDQADLRAEAAA